MDRLRITQKVTRSAFTRAYNAFQSEIRKQSPDITWLQIQFAIREKASKLAELSYKTQEAMLNADEDEETLLKEMEIADEYTAKYHQAKIELSRLTEERPTSTLSSQSSVMTTQENILVNILVYLKVCFEITKN